MNGSRPRRVLYVDFENDPRGDIRARLDAMEIGPDQLTNLCYLSYPSLAKLDTPTVAVDLVRQAKKSGQQVTAEVAPHHLLLTDEACGTLNGGYDTNTKMNPPLRTRADVDACIQGVVDGTLECLATDHAPHTREEKELEFDKAPFGIVGLETALPLYAKALVEPGHLTWLQLIDKMTAAPARIMGLAGKGTLARGAAADLTVFNPTTEWTIDPEKFRSKSRNTPFGGWRVKGRVTHTIVGGRVVYDGAGD